jgi:hypothetical protein
MTTIRFKDAQFSSFASPKTFICYGLEIVALGKSRVKFATRFFLAVTVAVQGFCGDPRRKGSRAVALQLANHLIFA